jgi:hypothetical protein
MGDEMIKETQAGCSSIYSLVMMKFCDQERRNTFVAGFNKKTDAKFFSSF